MTNIAEKDFWEKKWREYRYKPLKKNKYINKRLIELFSKYFRKGDKVIEIGCANSQWLPFLKTYFSVEIAGVDYSEKGIKNLGDFLENNNLKADLYHCDFKDSPNKLHNSFDVLISFGVIEHFTNHPEIIEYFSKFLKKEGIIITIIPNFTSQFYGYLQRKISMKIYKKHIIIDRAMLYDAHKGSFSVIYCNYYGAFEPALIDYSDSKGIKRIFFDILIGFSTRIIAPLFNLANIGSSNRDFSNYIICVAKKL